MTLDRTALHMWVHTLLTNDSPHVGARTLDRLLSTRNTATPTLGAFALDVERTSQMLPLYSYLPHSSCCHDGRKRWGGSSSNSSFTCTMGRWTSSMTGVVLESHCPHSFSFHSQSIFCTACSDSASWWCRSSNSVCKKTWPKISYQLFT